MKHRSLRRWTWSWGLQCAAIWFVVAAQVQLIFIAELHRHGYPHVYAKQATSFSAKQAGSPAPPAEQTPCIVCQIVRQGAARPATTSFAIRPLSRVVFHAPPVVRRFVTTSIITLPVRAPPPGRFQQTEID